MGWASAGQIFDPVAQAFIDASIDNATKTRILGDLIKQLQDGDWDTEDESLERFTHDPAIVEAFRRNGVYERCDAYDQSNDLDCNLETGHAGDHRDCRGTTWSGTGLRGHTEVLLPAKADLPESLQWQVRCPRCADAGIERGIAPAETVVDRAVGTRPSPIVGDDGRVSVSLYCAAGHGFDLVVSNHRGAEYISINA
jgi:hypothetical protein